MNAEIISSHLSFVFEIIILAVTQYFVFEKLLKARQSDFTQELYKRRINPYSKLFGITQNVGKQNFGTDKEIIDEVEKTFKEMEKWQGETEGYILLSKKSVGAFYELKQRLRKNPGDGKSYTKEQLSKVWKTRNSLRGALRDDLGLYYDYEKGL